MPSDAILALVTSGKTVTAALAQSLSQNPNSTESIADVARRVFPEKPETSVKSKSRKVRTHGEYTQEDLDRAERCGRFPYRPSDLFLKVRLACAEYYSVISW